MYGQLQYNATAQIFTKMHFSSVMIAEITIMFFSTIWLHLPYVFDVCDYDRWMTDSQRVAHVKCLNTFNNSTNV